MEKIVAIVAIVIIAYIGYRILRYVRKRKYFSSKEFLQHKQETELLVKEHHELMEYAEELEEQSYLYSSNSRKNASMATFENTSKHNYRRDANRVSTAPNVHNCSLTVVRNAADDPIAYLIKYFIGFDEETLKSLEKLGKDISTLRQMDKSLVYKQQLITESFRPPRFILKHYEDEFYDKVDIDIYPIDIPIPGYTFEYVSPGGNSSQRTSIDLDEDVIDEVIEVISQKIKFRKSAAGQRALMTSSLRTMIKERDGYTCQQCSISVDDEPHLLLEIDHIIPVSKGGLTTEENLQTLCWKCNRSKSNKILA